MGQTVASELATSSVAETGQGHRPCRLGSCPVNFQQFSAIILQGCELLKGLRKSSSVNQKPEGVDRRAFSSRVHVCAAAWTGRTGPPSAGIASPGSTNNDSTSPLSHLEYTISEPPYRAARRRTHQPSSQARIRGRNQSRIARFPVLGPDAAPNLRSRDAAQRRLLAAYRLHEQGRLRERLQQYAIEQRRSLADADHPRCYGGLRQDPQAR